MCFLIYKADWNITVYSFWKDINHQFPIPVLSLEVLHMLGPVLTGNSKSAAKSVLGGRPGTEHGNFLPLHSSLHCQFIWISAQAQNLPFNCPSSSLLLLHIEWKRHLLMKCFPFTAGRLQAVSSLLTVYSDLSCHRLVIERSSCWGFWVSTTPVRKTPHQTAGLSHQERKIPQDKAVSEKVMWPKLSFCRHWSNF